MKYKILLLTILCTSLMVLLPNFALGAEPINNVKAVNVYFFYAKTCPHCHDEAAYLAKLKAELADKINIISYELTENEANVKLLEKFGQRFNLDLGQMPVPETFIGDKSFIGFGSEEIDGANLKNTIEQCVKLNCPDVGQEIINAPETDSKTKNNTWPTIIIVGVVVIIIGLVLINKKKK